MTQPVPIILERDNVNDESVVLVRWFAMHGDKVEAGGLLAEIETSKANIEVFSPQAGFLNSSESVQKKEIPIQRYLV
jgi:pyruvate/2-oxoglutarate dehydrogenase complex dihydrolipoamide acyltransferase (E2) component